LSAGIYIHIPFCASKCAYCDFFSFKANEGYISKYIVAILNELQFCSYKELYFDTIYIGGGTPSCINPEYIKSILDQIRLNYTLADNVEITIEANNNSLREESLAIYKEAGVNRLNIGIQSFSPQILKALGRQGKAYDNNIWTYIPYYFDNIGIDLIYGLASQSIKNILKDISFIHPIVKHVSYYCLSIENGTLLYKNHKQQAYLAPENTLLQMQSTIEDNLGLLGYQRYEISNYAKAGYHSRHNLHYWSGDNYVGFGTSAVSTVGNIRFQNTTNLQKYLQKEYPRKYEYLSSNNKVNEYIMLGLRQITGINKGSFYNAFGLDFTKSFVCQLVKYKEYFTETQDKIALNKAGLNISNSILCDFLL